MNLLRRTTALLLGVVLFQVNLVGGGVACAEHLLGGQGAGPMPRMATSATGDAAGPAAMAGHEAMQAAHVAHAPTGSPVASSTGHDACGALPLSCGTTGGGGACGAMISCAAAVPASASAAAAGVPASAGVAATIVQAPRTRSLIPEPPPPRA